MTPVLRVLSSLEGVRSTGSDTWLARCPSHDDRSPSLSIREGSDGRVLIYCFAGCGASDVVSALGLDFADLFPPRQNATYSSPKTRSRTRVAPRISAADALRQLDHEALVVELIAHRLAKGDQAEKHCSDLDLAAGRIAAIRTRWEAAP